MASILETHNAAALRRRHYDCWQMVLAVSCCFRWSGQALPFYSLLAQHQPRALTSLRLGAGGIAGLLRHTGHRVMQPDLTAHMKDAQQQTCHCDVQLCGEP